MKIFNKVSIGSALSSSFAVAVLGLIGPMAVHAATSPALGDAATFSIISQTGATNTGITTISGDVGVLVPPTYTESGTTTFTTAGNPHLGDAAAAAAQISNTAAFGALAAGDNADANCIGGVLPSGTDLTTLSPLGPGLYCSGGTFLLTGNLTLTGAGPWVFKTVSALITSPGSSVTGGDSCDIWWRVGSTATLATTTAFKGNILALTSVGLNTGASLDGRALAQTGAVTLDANTVSIPVCAAPPSSSGSATGSINVVKVVINDNGRTGVINDFPLFVNGIPVGPSVPNSFPTPANYTITETSNANYTSSFSGDCDATGHITLNTYESKVCIITNNDIGPAIVVPPVPPLIEIVKVPAPLSLPAGPGSVLYTYTLHNIGTVPVNTVKLLGDTCSPIVRQSGDLNSNNILEVNETWVYTCATTLPATHTNTVTATGWANGIMATDIASATVVVGQPIVPPLIHITKTPSPLTLKVGGGVVTYTKKVTNPGTVALSNVTVTDDKCSPVSYISGDSNLDSKLDPSETWTYTCSQNLTQTTTNTAIATGQANGLTARDFALATVVVATAAPALPNTGFPTQESNSSRNMIIAGILMLAFGSLAIVLKKRAI